MQGLGDVFSRATGSDMADPTLDITITPSSVTYGEEIEILIEGLPPNSPMPFGVSKLAGWDLPLPGHHGLPGSKPVADYTGMVRFKTHINESTPSGIQTLIIDINGVYVGRASITFEGATLFLPTEGVVPNETITIRGSNFTPLLTIGGHSELKQGHGDDATTIMLDGRP